ncbi:MAG: protein kinase [Opitutales bacterium]|nr:protein kinase [Opitutales bacterium]
MEFDQDRTIIGATAQSSGGVRRLGNYELQKFLGEGGMGQVFLARHETMRRLCALKILPRTLAAQSSFVRRFRSEAQLMASLNHPHIVGIHNFDRSDGEFFIEMEFIDGGDLQQKIHAHRKGVPAGEVQDILRQILEAVAYAHEQSVIHRDLKPSNILMNKEGAVKIADFGLAAVVGESFQNSLIEKSMTQSRLNSANTIVANSQNSANNINGTLVYMSPQTLRGEKPCAGDDIYAVGVMAYYMITGRLPSVGYKRPSKVVRGLDRRWDGFIAKALEEDPTQRFASANEALAALNAIGRTRKLPYFVGAGLLLAAAAAAALAFMPALSPVREQIEEIVSPYIQSMSGPQPSEDTLPVPAILPTSSGAPAPIGSVSIPSGAASVEVSLEGTPRSVELRIIGLSGSGAVQSLTLPTSIQLPIREEPYELRFSSRGHEARTYRFDSERDNPRLPRIDLPALVRERPFRITTRAPETEVWAGDRFLGQTPLETNLIFERESGSVPWNPILLSLRHPDYEEVSLQVGVSDGPVLPTVDQRMLSRELTLHLPGGVPIRFVTIPPGTFIMGSPETEFGRQQHEGQREVQIERPFLMGVTTVTQDQFRALMGRNPSYFRTGGGSRPVEQVSFADVAGPGGFIERINQYLRETGQTRYTAALPTEAEWEYACRAGTTTAFNNGRDLESRSGDRELDRVAIYRRSESAPVASLAPNQWGLYDMHGNVWEWTEEGVLRGGSWFDGATSQRSASRLRGQRENRGENTRGFRLILREN